MASDIVPPSSSWATSYMKPDPGEETNALWSMQIADNTGWLFNRLSNSFQILENTGYEIGVTSMVRELTQASPSGFYKYGPELRFYNNGAGTLTIQWFVNYYSAYAPLVGSLYFVIKGVGTTPPVTFASTGDGGGIENGTWQACSFSLNGYGTVGWMDGCWCFNGSTVGMTYDAKIYQEIMTMTNG